MKKFGALFVVVVGLGGCVVVPTSESPQQRDADNGVSHVDPTPSDPGTTAPGDDFAHAGGFDFREPTSCAVQPSTEKDVVATTNGLVRGVDDTGAVAFKGIPYAAPPTGALRFKPTAPAACWSDVKDASDYGAQCPQLDITDPTLTSIAGDEDCLFVNVWTPALPQQSSSSQSSSNASSSTSSLRPVMFFIHGGANILGASSQDIGLFKVYDGASLASNEDAVVVSVNYRLGALGFLAHPALTAESEHHASGNYGIMDLVAALRWVHDNIARFGGDPSRVMVFGESAGAFDTCALLASPMAHGLFSAALMESGNCEPPSLAASEQLGVSEAQTFGCDDAACLRAASVDDLVHSEGDLPLQFVSYLEEKKAGAVALPYDRTVDGWVIPKPPLDAMKDGTANQVPLVIGTNHDEMAFFTAADVRPVTCDDAISIAHDVMGSVADEMLTHYSCDFLKPKQLLVDILTDVEFTCPTRRALRAQSQHQTTFRYFFTWAPPLSPLGTPHASELPFVFDEMLDPLSGAIDGYWGRYAAKNDPNGAAAPLWEAWDPTRDNALVLDDPIGAQDGVHDEQCDFWDSVGTLDTLPSLH